MEGAALYTCEMPLPPSVNNLFVNAGRGRGRFPSPKYVAWRREATLMMLRHGPTPMIASPVSLIISVGRKSRNDLDNCAKAVIDMLVERGVLVSDNKSVVRRIVLEWSHTQSVNVKVLAHAED